jgi:hypothetical protein
MSTITKYVVVDERDQEGDYEYDHLEQARAAAIGAGNSAVIAREYEYSDSDLVWTPNGAMSWPPKPGDEPEDADYAAKVRGILMGFESELCEECGGDLEQHAIVPDALGNPHAQCHPWSNGDD